MQINRFVIYTLVLLTIGWAAISVPHLKYATSLSELSSLDTSIAKHLQSQQNFFESGPKQAIIILENEKGWFHQAELILLNEITESWKQQRPDIYITAATIFALPVKNGFSVRFVNPLLNSDFNVETIYRFDDVYSKFFSKTGQYTLCYLDESKMNNTVRQFFDNIIQANQHLHVYYHYESILLNSINQESQFNFAFVSIVVLSLMIFAYYFFVRSWKLLMLILLMLSFQLAIVFLLLYYNDITITPQITTIPALIAVLSLSDMLHISYLFNRLKEVDEKSRKYEVLKCLKWSILLTSLTNCIGFIAIQVLSRDISLLAISWIGLISIISSMLSSIFLFTKLLNPKVNYYNASWDLFFSNWYTNIFTKFLRLRILIISVVLLITFFSAKYLYTIIPEMIQANSDIELNEVWNESGQILTKEFYGNNTLTIIVRSDVDLLNDAVIKTMIQVDSFITQNFSPFYIESYLNVLKRYNRYNFHGDFERFKIPDFTEDKLREFELTKNKLGWLAVADKHHTAAKIDFGFQSHSLIERSKKYKELENFLSEELSTDELTFELTGFNYWQDKSELSFITIVMAGMLLTFLATMFLIGIIKLSFVRGVVFMVVNYLPISCAVILMYWFNVPLNTFTVFMLTLLLGLCLDDSIYMILTKDSYPFKNTLYPIILTTIVMAVAMIGFSFSFYDWLRPFGVIFFISFTIALLGDILILPLIINSKQSA